MSMVRDPWCAMCPMLNECVAWGVSPQSFECEALRYNAGHLEVEQTALHRLMRAFFMGAFREGGGVGRGLP